MRSILVNWKSSAAALAAAGVLITELSKLVDGDTTTVVNWEFVGMQIAIVWGFLSTRDATVTSEQSGAK